MEYTLDELVAAVGSRITATGLDRQANGQVNAFPDRRTLRYYTTIGLMDRPDTVRDRQAIYGDRHVVQAVAVKRLQAAGLTLAAVQGRLAGLPPEAMEAIAAGRDSATTPAGGALRQRRFWTHDAPPARARLAAFPKPAAAASPQNLATAPPTAAEVGASWPLLAIALAGDATLLLTTDHPLTGDDVAAIRHAAAALVDHLTTAGLLPSEQTDDSDRKDCR